MSARILAIAFLGHRFPPINNQNQMGYLFRNSLSIYIYVYLPMSMSVSLIVPVC